MIPLPPATALRACLFVALTGLLALVPALHAAAAGAGEPAVVVNGAETSFQLGGTLDILMEADGGTGIDAITRKARSSFSPTPADTVFALGEGKTLWIRLRLQRDSMAPPDWTLRIPLPYLDHAALYQADRRGGWGASQVAGDTNALERWTHPALYPDFAVTLPESGVLELYLEVRNFKPIALPLLLATAPVRDRQREVEYIWLGVMIGALLMLIGVCGIHYLQGRSRAEGWYTGYATLVLLVVSTTTGLASMWLWPSSPMWANYAHMALPILGVGATVLFVRHMSSLDVGFPRLARVLYAFGLSALPFALLCAAIDQRTADHLNAAYLAVGPILTVTATALVWRRGYAVGKWLFLSYVPQGLSVLFMAAQVLHLVPAWWEARYVMVMCIALAVPLLQQALHTRARERREAQDRAEALPTQDALTGLLTAPLFQQQVETALNRAKHDREPSAIVLVDVVNFKYLRDSYGDAVAEQCLLRAAVKLHRVLRDVDPAGRVGTSRFGMVLDGMTSRQALTERMVRLIASGLIPLPGLKPEVTLQFHVACVLLTELIPDSQRILGELGEVLEGISPRTRRPIRFLDPAMTSPSPLSTKMGPASELPTQPNA
jgi:diguanylate cyclase (GGDEF)-like protein